MIDHETARRSVATSLDFPLEPDEDRALDDHLRDCPACRSFAAAARDDAATLRELDFGPVPIAVRANVAIAAEHRGRGVVGRWIAIVAVGALLLVGLGGGALGVGGQRGGSAEPGKTNDAGTTIQVAWKTDVAALTAREFSITTGGQTFRAATPTVDVTSDPGTATRRTLEATWHENGVEMRLNLYFGGDETAWWIDEVRIYNGAPNGGWLYAKGPLFKTPLGAAWTGDQDIEMDDPDGVGGTPARVHLGGLMLATRPVNVANDGGGDPPGDPPVLAEMSEAFLPGGSLYCSGILQMAPRDAEQHLRKLGYRVAWHDQVTGATSEAAPDGVITLPPVDGPSGTLDLFVTSSGDPKPIPFPADCPRSDPNLTPPPPAP